MDERRIYPMSKVDPAATKTELSCGSTKATLLYFRDRFGQQALEEFVYETRMNLDYVMDRTNWISLDYNCRLLDKLVEYSGDPNAPFEAGTYVTEQKSLGPLSLLVARFATVRSMYRCATSISGFWSKVNAWEMLASSSTSCTISVRNYSYPQNRNNCLCIQGVLASVPRWHGLPPAKIKELQCACDGADSCVYELSWADKPTRQWGLRAGMIGCVAGAGVAAFTGWHTYAIVIWALASLSSYFVGRGLDYTAALRTVQLHSEEQAKSLADNMHSAEEMNKELQKKVERRTEELSQANSDLQQALRDLGESQEKAMIAEKQAAVGVLASGMAHEMNNPINAIRISLQTLQEDLAGDATFRQVLETAIRGTSRCKRSVEEFLNFSREPLRMTNVDLREIVDDSLAFFKKEHSEHLHIEERITSNLPTLLLDRAQIQQAITNLLANASDAMAEQGTIDVTLATDAGDVVLSVSDHGPGMDESIRHKIFDPFFTTKSTGKGMGLGLSITYQLVRSNGGQIDMSTRKGEGTTFVIRFPVRTEDSTEPFPNAQSEVRKREQRDIPDSK